MEERLRGVPGVRSTGLAQVTVFAGNDWENGITIQGYRAKPGEDMSPWFNSVSPGYFETLGVHLLDGRGFTAKDDTEAPKVAIVNAAFVKHFFGDAPAVGRRIGQGIDPGTPTDIEIIGVINDTHYETLRQEVPRQVFLSAWQRDFYGMAVYVRSASPRARSMRFARRCANSIPICRLSTRRRSNTRSTSRWSRSG